MEETIIPIEEPKRQGYFISCLNDIIQLKAIEKGRQPSYKVVTFGCQMNARDSEKLAGILTDIGYVETDTEENADLVLFNTCTVRENANERLYGRLGQLKRSKKNNKDMLIGLCGCMMQEAEEVEKIRKSYGYVDIVFGTHNIYKLAEILYNRLENKKQVVDVIDSTKMIVENLPSKRVYPFKSGVNITFGCNNFCTFCIVPYVRGRERSRLPEDIVSEIKSLVADGVVEVMLLGQNVNSYGRGLEKKTTFTDLLAEIVKIEGLKRVRFMTPHPKDFSDDLIELIKDNPKICRHIHLPLQSGNTGILKKMNRVYTKEQYLDLAYKIKKEIPDVSLTTDIIVGFPGETQEDFLDTLDVVEKVQYDAAFTFIYSKRTGTPAAKMELNIDENELKQRFDTLLKRVQHIAAANTAKHVGKVYEALIESKDEQLEGYVTGRLSNNMIVHLKGEESMIGSIIKVSLDESKGFYYMGHAI
jgi:tRNA-i(6)A37 thiotransferase enzyme miaB